MKILLISGHGAGDTGARGNGLIEANVTRELVNILAPKLRVYAEVDVYDQTRNAFYDCQNGTFNIGKYDYVFEVHFNAFNLSAHGTECFVVPEEKGITVEQEIMKRMGKWFTLRDNDNIFDGVKKTRFLVINTVKQRGMSGALLETCFIDNESDMAIYQKNKDAIANGIVEGIAVGFGLNGKPAPAPTPKPIPQPAPKPQPKKLHLPATATSWYVYPTNKAPVIGNQSGILNPSLFGGLAYDILAYPQSNVVTIQTRDFGRVNIYVAAGTGAVIK